MKAITISRAAIVGIFIFLGIAIFIAAVFTIGGQQKAFAKTISVKSIFHDIEGLQAGNNIWLYGVKIGTIKKISFYGKDEVEVDMSIIKTAQPHIPKDAKAKISTDGFIGNKIITIYGGTSPEAVADKGSIESVNTISSDDIMATLQANNKNILDITNAIKHGQGAIGKLIEDSSMANELGTTVKDFESISSHGEKTIEQLNMYIAGMNKEGTLANELVTDTVVFSNLIKTTHQLRNAAANISGMTANLNTASEAFNKDSTPVGVIFNSTQVGANLKTMIQNLASSSQKLDEDLAAVQHNFLFRGYFRRQAKQKQKEQDALKKDSSTVPIISK